MRTGNKYAAIICQMFNGLLIQCGQSAYLVPATMPNGRDRADVGWNPAAPFRAGCSVGVDRKPEKVAKCMTFPSFPFGGQGAEEFSPVQSSR